MSRAIGLYNAGTVALMEGSLTSAIDLLEQAATAATATPLRGSIWRNLGLALRKSGDNDGAIRAFQQAIDLDHSDSDAWYSLGNTHMAMSSHTEAIRAFQTVRELKPEWSNAANNEGAAWMAIGRASEAEACFSMAVRLDPEASQAWGNLGAARAAMGRHAAPLHALQRALELDPHDTSIRCKLGHLLTELGHFDAAIRTFEVVLKTHPDHANARAGCSLALHRQGDSIGALASIAPAIATEQPHPDEVVTYARICMHMDQAADARAVLEQSLIVAKQPATKVLLGKQLGQVLDAIGQADAAFAAIDQANQLKNLRFDPLKHRANIDDIVASFDPCASRSDCIDESPVFIVGVPRSGTSLIEQMLDGHPDVHGAGERGELQMIAAHMADIILDTGGLNQLADAYLTRLKPLAPHAKRITDKMPDNFLVLGEAARLFPNARVIHCTRDPADTGLSILFQHFKDTLPWATRQEDIAAYIEDYRRLMDHWASHCPLRMMTVPYESLVHDPMMWGRRLTTFLGLPFHPDVLQPQNNPRVVRTASFDQIRRPIHTNSVGRFRSYADHIPRLMALRGQNPQCETSLTVQSTGQTHAR